MLLSYMTWPDVERHLAEDSRGVIVPIGSTEQHGPTGLIGTDALCAEVIAQRVGELTDAVVAPTINIGMAQHHMAFTGTITLRPSTLTLVVRDIVMSLARHGFERFFFINGHGGNITTVKNAFSEIYNEVAEQRGAAQKEGGNNPPDDMRLALHNWWESEPVTAMRKAKFGDREGMHATCSEVSITWYKFPEQRRTLPLEDVPPVRSGFRGPEDFREKFPDGRMGSNPTLATPEHGKELFDLATEELAKAYRAFLAA